MMSNTKTSRNRGKAAQKLMTNATLNKMRPCLWVFAALLLGFEAFRCTSDAMDMARQGLSWNCRYWMPCSLPLYLLLEAIFTKSRKALIISTALLFLDLCYILFMIDTLSWFCLVLIPVSMIVLLIHEDNNYLKLLNLITIGMLFLGLFRVSR